MHADGFRDVNYLEMRILRKMIEAAGVHSLPLMTQVREAKVQSIDKLGSIKFMIDPSLRAKFPDGPILNAQQPDNDTVDGLGPYINFIIFASDGLIQELQIYRDDGRDLIICIDPEKFTPVYPNSRLK
jgi:hypothetical protein